MVYQVIDLKTENNIVLVSLLDLNHVRRASPSKIRFASSKFVVGKKSNFRGFRGFRGFRPNLQFERDADFQVKISKIYIFEIC